MLHVTPEMMEQTYDLLRITKPFRIWKLPDPDGIRFHVTKDNGEFASFDVKGGHPVICVTLHTARTLNSLTMHLAHEMIHLYQWKLKLPQNHGNHFQICKARVCKEHSFDPGVF